MKTPVFGFCLVLIVLIFASCSITSRKYMSGYNVEWQGKSPAAHQNAAITKSIEKAQTKDFPIVNRDNIAVQQAPVLINKPAVPIGNKVVAHVEIRPVVEKKSVIAPHMQNSKALASAPGEDVGKNDFGIKLAKQSFILGIIACCIALGFGGVILYSVIVVTQKLILEIVLIGLAALAVAFLAYLKGRRSMPILFGDDTVDDYYKKAATGKAMGYIIIIALLLSLVVSLAFFN